MRSSLKISLAKTSLAAMLLSLGACSSWIQSLKGDGDDDAPSSSSGSSRAPSSNGQAITLNNGGMQAPGEESAPEPSGPNLGANEFASKAKASDDRAARGFRRDADPWDGTGPVNEGSLWNGDGQDNFYFSKNLMHKMGDIVIVKLENDVTDALNTKIGTLLARSTLRQTVADESGKAAAQQVGDKVGTALGNENVGRAVGAAAGSRVTASLDRKEKYIDLDEIPVRIVESLPRSSFKVEGSRRVNIRNAPYMLKISGVVRDEDIGPQGMVATSKVFDSKMELTR